MVTVGELVYPDPPEIKVAEVTLPPVTTVEPVVERTAVAVALPLSVTAGADA
jgi:hypothetical protein